jgi:hypothetical protein
MMQHEAAMECQSCHLPDYQLASAEAIGQTLLTDVHAQLIARQGSF